jgi:hypothetical protein
MEVVSVRLVITLYNELAWFKLVHTVKIYCIEFLISVVILIIKRYKT